ncbi:endolysin [Burkholderia phage BcepNazgul]|uniref:Endolysin n=1 Tax=Burkholderia phage BcepNazgul TaxID=242861 RepID=Q6UYK3_9CAUD|nr:endolysin [Burkholderia phage BcepNazgul]AAQ63338.2 endolysin [Burkholderia phage BcepNazgul]
MPRITPELAGHLNVCAFMDTIAYAEGTSTSPVTQDDGYDILVNSIDAQGNVQHNRFTDFSDHPFMPQFGRKPFKVNSKGLYSTASGRYQQMLKDWPHYKTLLRLTDFAEIAQDLTCLQHLKESRAIEPLKAGDFLTACDRVSNIWASIPGTKNTYGQPKRQLDALRATYILNGGTCQ